VILCHAQQALESLIAEDEVTKIVIQWWYKLGG
jgi:hypothetical protein